MGVVIDAFRRTGNADFTQQFKGTGTGFPVVQGQVGLDRFDQLPADGIEWVERSQGILKYGADAAAADPAQFFVGQVINAPAFQDDFALGDTAWRLQQADNGGAGQGFTGARFTHHPKYFAWRNIKRDVIHRHQGAMPGGKFNPQVADRQQGLAAAVWLVHAYVTAAWGSGRHAANRPTD